MDEQPQTATTDEQLAARAQAGCESSFAFLVRRYQSRLLLFLRQRAATQENAEDAVQESFLTAYRALHRYDRRWRFSTWMFTIAKRIAHRTSVRERRNEPTVEQLETLHHAGDDGVPKADEWLLREETRQLFWQAVRSWTTADEFTATWLYYVEEMSIREIATVLERTNAGTKMLLCRTRKKLKRRLSSESSRRDNLLDEFLAAWGRKAG